MMRRWPRVRRAVVALFALGIIAVGGLAVAILLYGAADRARPADVIVVLGGGEIATERRARHAATLYAQGYAPYVLCAGMLKAGERPLNEANLCRVTALGCGVPVEAVVLEERSRSTEENAIEAAALMRARGWRRAIIVSDDFHLLRARILFGAQGVRVWTSPAGARLAADEKALAVLREMAALGWYAGKELLGLDRTRVSG